MLKSKQKRQDSSLIQTQALVLVQVVSEQSKKPIVPGECFVPFVFDGCLSLTGCGGGSKPIKILRDTGASSFCSVFCHIVQSLRVTPALLFKVLKWVLCPFSCLFTAYGCCLIWSLDVLR